MESESPLRSFSAYFGAYPRWRGTFHAAEKKVPTDHISDLSGTERLGDAAERVDKTHEEIFPDYVRRPASESRNMKRTK